MIYGVFQLKPARRGRLPHVADPGVPPSLLQTGGVGGTARPPDGRRRRLGDAAQIGGADP